MAVRATSFVRGSGSPFDSLVLTAEERHLRRKLVTLRNGLEVLVDFEKPVRLEHGDLLMLEDGRCAAVIAAEEKLLEVRAKDAEHLARLAWHIGNRHLEAEIGRGRILLRRDRVIAAMLIGLGAELREVVEPFKPEHGAYHSHDH